MKHAFLMTTSPSFDGYEVEKYLGVVTSNVVTGTGIFSDIAASFSDFFGGRSIAYKKQLESIREEAINELENKARALGANAVVGLSVDNDQISGKNTQMLMITVTATAVVLKQADISGIGSQLSDVVTTLLSSEDVKQRVRLKELQSADEELSLEQLFKAYKDVFALLPKLDVARLLVKRFLRSKYEMDSSDQGRNQMLSYLMLFSADELQSLIYEEIQNLENPLSSLSYLGVLAQHFDIYDDEHISKLLQMNNDELAIAGLVACFSKQPYYEAQDIFRIRAMLKNIENRFPIKREITDKKKSLGRVARVWVCANGHENDEERKICLHCQLSLRDVPKYLFEDTVTKLKLRAESLEIAFSDTN
ncbi:YbjQ family protein [Pseudidiomarina sp.]|uniref:YbjQ family protein n=1 Tax=Pseudidiomarina sp. TaxID=2081707 RepID=UPI003A978A98